jgi:hypothetical protein
MEDKSKVQKAVAVGRLLFFGGWAFWLAAHTKFLPYKPVLSANSTEALAQQLCSSSATILLIFANIRDTGKSILLQDSRQAEANDEKGSRQPAAV